MLPAKLCIPIIGPTLEEARRAIARATFADLIELRLDLIEWERPEQIEALMGEKPTIFTLKGEFDPAILELRPAFADLDVEKLPPVPAGVQTIASYHDYIGTPADLEGLLATLKKRGADYYKVATTAHSAADALRVLELCKRRPGVIGMGMGPAGIATRVLAGAFGAPWTYAALDEANSSAPGQLTAEVLLERYHFRSLSEKTQILGLLGGRPVSSPGIAKHNQAYAKLGLDAVYLPFPCASEELPRFLSLAATLGIRGLSVTMPLKEAICPLVETEEGAVNTLVLRNGHYVGSNFDGIGACNALGDIKGKQVLIIGAGGAGRAIAVEAKRRGAQVRVINRTPERARHLAEETGVRWGRLEEPLTEEIVVQATSVGMEPQVDASPIDPSRLPAGARVLEIITRPVETAFLKGAKARGCQTVTGEAMWRHQAAHQMETWFGISAQEAYEYL
ncbi:MAG: type I 3-dehydroquinate dehydratase [Parachlamydiales bacterium]